MNSILVILITGMAVLGAYYLAELFSEGMEKPKNDEAVLVLPGPVTPAQVLEITAMVRQKLPRCQVIAGLGDRVPTRLCRPRACAASTLSPAAIWRLR